MPITSAAPPVEAIYPLLPTSNTLGVQLAGEGDYCHAYRTDDGWMFLVGKHEHAAACLERVARLTPLLSMKLNVPIPVVEHHTCVDGQTLVGYRSVPGVPLAALPVEARRKLDLDILAQDLARFFQKLHSFDVTLAAQSGVPVSAYGFGMQEDHWVEGEAKDLYHRDLSTYLSSGAADQSIVPLLEQALERHLHCIHTEGDPLVLLHNEVSLDHVLLDTATDRVSGVIDFNGMVIGRRTRDFLYLYETFGESWTERLLGAYALRDPEEMLEELRFLHIWHTLQRLSWAERNSANEWLKKCKAELYALVKKR